MKQRYSFSSKQTKRATKSPKMRKQKSKYPFLLKKVVEESDIILEILDARFPQQTRNLEIETFIRNLGKELIFVLNKSDLIINSRFSQKPSVKVSCSKRVGSKKLRDLIKQLAKKIKKEKIVIGVIGYPNTGKSSLINLLIGRSSAKTGSEAGFTKGLQKLNLTKEMQLLDSPGVIPEREYSCDEKTKIAKYTIVGGRSFSQVREPELIIDSMLKQFPNILEKHYNVDSEGDVEILLEKLGKKFNYLKKGGIVDDDKTARRILKDWQIGLIRIS